MKLLNKVKGKPEFIVKKFYADWCTPCIKVVGPMVDKLSTQYDNILFESYNVDEDFDVADSFDVVSVPTVIIMNKNGEEIKRLIGPFTESEFASIIS